MLQCTMGTCAILIPDKATTKVPICGIVGCSTRPGITKDVKFYKTMNVLLNQGVDTRTLSEDYVVMAYACECDTPTVILCPG